ncbi:hypothetical protein Fmac_008753 [Flemingia macrophylla]|uniref:Uncharacterized protein n=1 Tax=Flemingia macrophylla TaxID=520843 RepID=A0ABD1MYB5_9FABA
MTKPSPSNESDHPLEHPHPLPSSIMEGPSIRFLEGENSNPHNFITKRQPLVLFLQENKKLLIIDYPSLFPFLANLLRRRLYPDSCVCTSCAHVIVALSGSYPFSSFLKPLAQALFTEQDLPSQAVAALCLSSTIASFPHPDPPGLSSFSRGFSSFLGARCLRPNRLFSRSSPLSSRLAALPAPPRWGTCFPTSWRCSAAMRYVKKVKLLKEFALAEVSKLPEEDAIKNDGVKIFEAW